MRKFLEIESIAVLNLNYELNLIQCFKKHILHVKKRPFSIKSLLFGVSYNFKNSIHSAGHISSSL